jgi:hypothetical protein
MATEQRYVMCASLALENDGRSAAREERQTLIDYNGPLIYGWIIELTALKQHRQNISTLFHEK